MNKYVWLIIFVILISFGLNRLSNNIDISKNEKETIKIGVILPLSGNQANSGEVGKKAVQMALEDILLENNKYNYELVIEDDSFQTKKTAVVANKLVNVDKVNAILSFSSGSGNVVSPIAEKGNVIHFGMASDGNIAKGKFNFMHWTTPRAEARKLVDKLIEDKITRLSVVSVNHSATNAMLEDIKEFVKGTNIQILSVDKSNIGERDFKTSIYKLKSLNPEIIYLELFSPEQEIFVKQLRELGLNIPLTNLELFAMSEQLELFEDQWFIDTAVGDDKFNDKFAKFSGLSSTFSAPFMYDCVRIIHHVAENIDGELSQDKLAEGISNLENYKGVVGKIKVDHEGIFQSQASVKIVKNGKIEVVGDK